MSITFDLIIKYPIAFVYTTHFLPTFTYITSSVLAQNIHAMSTQKVVT